LKIGFDAKRAFNNFTGLGNYSRTLLSNLSKFYPENEYHLFTPKVIRNAETQFLLESKFKIHKPQNALDGILWRTAKQSKVINKLGLDIYHGLSHELPFGISEKTKTVVTFHDLIYKIHPELFPGLDAKVYAYKYKSAAQRADKIISISNHTKQDVKKFYGIPDERVEVVYQSLADTFFKIPPQDNKGSYFLYVGSIIQRKGLSLIIKALAQFPLKTRPQLKVVGDGKAYKVKCLRLIEELGLTKHITIIPHLENHDLPDMYDNAIALLLPSAYEGFGIPIIEALFRKIPVITTKSTALEEAAGPGGILISNKDVNALKTAMEEMLDPVKRRSFGDAGFQYVTRHFDSNICTKQVMDIYKSLAK